MANERPDCQPDAPFLVMETDGKGGAEREEADAGDQGRVTPHI